MLLQHLRAGADIELVRPKFATVPKQTWSRWVKIAEQTFRDEGGKPGRRASAPPPRKKKKQAPAKKTDGANVLQFPGRKKKKKPGKQDLVPAEPPPPPTPDEGMYLISAVGSVKETAIIEHFMRQTKLPDAHDALSIIDRVGQQFTHAEALMRSALKRAGDGHAIVDAQSFAAGVDLQLKSMQTLHKVLKDARNLTSVQRFLAVVMEALEKEDKAFARRVVALLRTAARSFAPTL
jgi:hypothetical protein